MTSARPYTPQNQQSESPEEKSALLLKEVIQPHLPTSGITSFRDVTGGVYKTRERIHGAVADAPLLAIPASWSRIADSNPN